MWFVLVPLVLAVGAMPFLIRRRIRQLDQEHPPVSVAEVADVEMADTAVVLETTVCDVVEWLNEARERLDITEAPVLESVDTGGSVRATRITFEIKMGRREIWLSGPPFMQPLPRIRDPEWKSSDGGIEFVRSASGLERAVFESCVKRE